MILNSLNPDQWVITYSDVLYKYSVHHVDDPGLAEDLVQETFLSAWKARNNFRGEASEKNWLFKICKNKIIDYFRKKNRHIIPLFEEDEWNDHFFDYAGNWKEDKPRDWGHGYQEANDTKEFYVVLDKCLKGLKQKQQAAFSMRYFDGLEAEEICKILRITQSNYWVLIHRAKLQLRSCLEKNWVNL